MTGTEQSHNPNFQPGKMSPEGVRVLEKGIVYQLPTPAEGNFGLAAVLDIGGKMPDANFDYGDMKDVPPVQESDFTMLLAIDLRAEGADKWVNGCSVPEGATTALIDPKGMQIDQDGTVTEGVLFLKPGSALIIGRGDYRDGDPQSGFKRLSVKAAAVSYKHLDVGVDKEGNIAIRDRNSTSGTLMSTGEAARDAVNEIGEHHEHHMRFKRVLGEEATAQVVPEPEQELSPSDRLRESLRELQPEIEKAPDIAAARKKLENILGTNSKGGGTLGEALRNLGPNPEAIRRRLQDKGKERSDVLALLEQRARQLSQSKDAEGKSRFLPGVVEGRMKDVKAASSAAGEVSQMESLAYVAQIAYDKLSGDFEVNASDSEGGLNDGHHRDAAEKVLADFAKEQVTETEALLAENERVKVFFEHVKTELRNVGNGVEGRIISRLMELPRAIHGQMVDAEALLDDVRRIEQARLELESTMRRLLSECHQLQSEGRTVSDPDARQIDEVEQQMRNIKTALDFKIQNPFWQRITGAALSRAYDAMSLNAFREQIIRHEEARQIASDLQRTVIPVTERYQ